MSVHIGEEIKKRAKELRIGPTELAQLVNSSKQNIYSIYKRKSIDSELLYRISLVLRYDFFQFYSLRQTEFSSEKAMYTAGPANLDALTNELQDCRKKYNLLRALFHMSEGKEQI